MVPHDLPSQALSLIQQLHLSLSTAPSGSLIFQQSSLTALGYTFYRHYWPNLAREHCPQLESILKGAFQMEWPTVQ